MRTSQRNARITKGVRTALRILPVKVALICIRRASARSAPDKLLAIVPALTRPINVESNRPVASNALWTSSPRPTATEMDLSVEPEIFSFQVLHVKFQRLGKRDLRVQH